MERACRYDYPESWFFNTIRVIVATLPTLLVMRRHSLLLFKQRIGRERNFIVRVKVNQHAA